MNLPAPPVEELAQETIEAEEIDGVAEVQSERAATDGDELQRLQGLWVKIVDQINARSKNVASVFRDSNLVRPHSISANVVTLSFRYPIQADRCRKEPWRSVIEQAVSRVLGYQVRVESILFDQDEGASGVVNGGKGPSPAGGAPRSARPTQSPYETTRGKAAMNIFGIDKFEDPQ